MLFFKLLQLIQIWDLLDVNLKHLVLLTDKVSFSNNQIALANNVLSNIIFSSHVNFEKENGVFSGNFVGNNIFPTTFACFDSPNLAGLCKTYSDILSSVIPLQAYETLFDDNGSSLFLKNRFTLIILSVFAAHFPLLEWLNYVKISFYFLDGNKNTKYNLYTLLNF